MLPPDKKQFVDPLRMAPPRASGITMSGPLEAFKRQENKAVEKARHFSQGELIKGLYVFMKGEMPREAIEITGYDSVTTEWFLALLDKLDPNLKQTTSSEGVE